MTTFSGGNLQTTTDTDANGNGVDLALLLSWGLWLYSGFFSLGALAGEVKNPSRTFPLVIVIMMPLVATLNIWPLAVSVVRQQLLCSALERPLPL